MDAAPFCVPTTATIRDTMQRIDATARGIALVTGTNGELLGTITDGDVRRAILAGRDLFSPVTILLEGRTRAPLTATMGTPEHQLLLLLREHSVRHIPLLDSAGRPVKLALLESLTEEPPLPLQAVVMAGGFGQRLRPLTNELPKPMLPVGDRPLLEHIIEQLRRAGIGEVHLTTHYKPEAISDHFGDGDGFGVQIHYVHEERPLGTAGALSLMDRGTQPLLIMNGDILTKTDFRAMLDFHNDQHAAMTVAVREHQFQVPYGVVQTEGVLITAIQEKPIQRHFINAGIYLLSPECVSMIAPNERTDMPQLITRLIESGRRVVSFPVHEYWLDIGQLPDYERAMEDRREGLW